MGKKTGFMGGIILGAALGAIGGILFAPKKGSHTRKELKSKAEKYGKQAQTTWSDLQKKGEQLKKEVKKVSQDVAGETQQQVNTLLQKTGITNSPKSNPKSPPKRKRFFRGV